MDTQVQFLAEKHARIPIVRSELEITGGHRTFAVHFTNVTGQLPFC